MGLQKVGGTDAGLSLRSVGDGTRGASGDKEIVSPVE
jgi:hypothetical protein